MTENQLEKLLDRLPFFDGSGRRRFVSGGIVVIGIAAFHLADLQTALGQVELKDFFASPVIAGGVLLLIYALGSIVDLFGELFLVRAASGVFSALASPFEPLPDTDSRVTRLLRSAIRWLKVIPRAVSGVLRGFAGRTSYRIPLDRHLSQNAQSLLGELPEKIATGLVEPVGDNAEVATKYLIDQFSSESDRKWARRLVSRAKDVATTTTALLIVLFYALATGRVGSLQSLDSVGVDVLNAYRGAYQLARDSRIDVPYLNRGIEELLRRSVDLQKPISSEIVSELDQDARRLRGSQGVVIKDGQALSLLRDLRRLLSWENLRVSPAEEFYGPGDKENLPARIPESEWQTGSYPFAQAKALVEQVNNVSATAYNEANLAHVNEKLKAEKTVSDQYLEELDRKLVLGALLGTEGLLEKVNQYNQKAQGRIDATSQRIGLLSLTALFSLLLYLGFFTSLRNAVTGMLEALATRSQPIHQGLSDPELQAAGRSCPTRTHDPGT